MSPSESFAAAARTRGQPVVLRRFSLGPGNTRVPLDVTVYGFTRSYQPQELVNGGGVSQGDTEVNIETAEIAAAQWPAPPKKGDVMVFDGRNAVIQAVDPKKAGAEVFSYVCQVRG